MTSLVEVQSHLGWVQQASLSNRQVCIWSFQPTCTSLFWTCLRLEITDTITSLHCHWTLVPSVSGGSAVCDQIHLCSAVL